MQTQDNIPSPDAEAPPIINETYQEVSPEVPWLSSVNTLSDNQDLLGGRTTSTESETEEDDEYEVSGPGAAAIYSSDDLSTSSSSHASSPIDTLATLPTETVSRLVLGPSRNTH